MCKKHEWKTKVYSQGCYDEEIWDECVHCGIQLPVQIKGTRIDQAQGKRVDQVEGSAFFVGLSFAGIIALLLWGLIYDYLTR